MKNLSTSPEVIEAPKSHEPHSQDNQQASSDHLFQTSMEDEDSRTISKGENSLVHENDGFTTCLSVATIFIQEITNSKEDNLYRMVEEDVQRCPNKEMDPYDQDYIERWFQAIVTSKHHYLLQEFFISYHL